MIIYPLEELETNRISYLKVHSIIGLGGWTFLSAQSLIQVAITGGQECPPSNGYILFFALINNTAYGSVTTHKLPIRT